MILKIWSVAYLVALDGLRRYALIGLIILSCALEFAGLLFIDFFPRDVGRASGDFVLSVGWLSGLLFLFFHAVYVTSWDDDRRSLQTLLARPISRCHYVIGIFCGLAALLFLLNVFLGVLGYAILTIIRESIGTTFFPYLDHFHYILAWLGLYFIELMVLSIIVLFSGIVRGGFPLLLLTVSYYLICNGLPVVRNSFFGTSNVGESSLATILKWMTALFPDFNRFDFKPLITNKYSEQILFPFVVDLMAFSLYIFIALWGAIMVYQRRDL